MRNGRMWSRSLAGALAVWFGLVMAAPAVLHSCPKSVASAGTAGDEHAHHGAQHSDDGAPTVPTECRCLGSCAVSTPAVLPDAPSTPAAVIAILPVDLLRATAFLPVPPQRDHVQPFATAPPLQIG